MTPNTFEAVARAGPARRQGRRAANGAWGGGYFDKIKERNSRRVRVDVGGRRAPDGSSAASTPAAPTTSSGDFSIGAIDYYSDDIINIFYTEAKYGMPLSEDREAAVRAAVLRPASVGDDLLSGERFQRPPVGRARPNSASGGALFTAAYTSADGDANMRNPWSGYPGYTSVQVEDFNRDGEDAWMLRAGYNFAVGQGPEHVRRCTSTAPTRTIPAQFATRRIRLQPAVDACRRAR